MKVVLSWLREFCPTDLSADELAEALTVVGVKVEGVIQPWEGLAGVVAAQVLEVSDHPNSDKLCVTRIKTDSLEATVCAGVRNMKVGDIVPYAPPGSRVPVLAEPLQAKELRGVMSEGMLCSPRELHIAEVHTGILVLPGDTPLGADVAERFGLSDAVLDIEIEPNRPDLMSVIGVAREVAALTGVPLVAPSASPAETKERAEGAATVEIRDLERCPHYVAKIVRAVTVGDSPIQIQARLSASGMRPISNVVDATNYVLLERGHPLHPFDLALLAGSQIVVRAAAPGEGLTTLDGVERTLAEDDLLIADRENGVAIAGIMGSAAAEVSDSTTDILLESAYFSPTGILRTARRLGLSTEASMRFERGADPEAVTSAADRAASLIAEVAGGTVLGGAVAAGGVPARRSASVRPERATAVLGMGDLTSTAIAERLGSVGFQPTAVTSDLVEVQVPGYRVDVDREIDLIEEIVRVGRGYESVPATIPAVRQPGGLPEGYAFRKRVREVMVREGFDELRSLSFASADDLSLMGDPVERAIRVANPLSAEDGYLRVRLTPGLMRAVQRNRAHNVRSIRLFETGVTFRAGDPVEEVQKVGFVLSGPASESWAETARDVDYFDATGVLASLFAGLGISAWSTGEAPDWPFHPGRSATIEVAGKHAGVVGELHPRVIREWDLGGRVAIGVLSIGPLAASASREVAYREVPRFPPSLRDLAFVLDEDVPARAAQDAITEAGGDALGSVNLFDVFTGEPLPTGKRSLAFSLEFRAPDRTMTDSETDEVVARIAERLAGDLGAELRG